jgi:hypothetical protein
MKFYYFGGLMGHPEDIKSPSNLDKHHFAGVMFTHDIPEGDMFVKTAIDINPDEKIKYLIAIRPYTISPQYLSMINQSMNKISKDRLQINFISGYIKDHESHVKGIVGDINDQSSSIDRSNYMINFLETLNKMQSNENSLDFYVSTTNEYVFAKAKEYNSKIIIPYSDYKRGTWTDHKYNQNPSANDTFDLQGLDVMISLTPIIRKTHEELSLLSNYALRPVWKKGEIPAVVGDVGYFTYEEFDDFVNTLEKQGIKSLLINAVPAEEVSVIVPFIKEYVEAKENKQIENGELT